MSTCESRAYEHLRCLQAPYIGKQDEVGQAVIDRIADGFRGLRIASADIVSELGDIINGTLNRSFIGRSGETLLQPRRRWQIGGGAPARPSSTSGKWAGSIGS